MSGKQRISINTLAALRRLALCPQAEAAYCCVSRSNRPRQQSLRERCPHLIRSFNSTSIRQERFPQMVIKTQRQYPVLLPTLLIATLASVSLLGVLAYDEYYKETPKELPYPADVERRLRKALHFTHVEKDPDQATKYFLEAISEAEESELDPFSDVVIGIRIRFAQMLEEFGRMQPAIEVLESIVRDSKDRLKTLPPVLAPRENPEGWEVQSSPQIDMWVRLNRLIVECLWRTATLYESDYLQLNSQGATAIEEAMKIIVQSTPPAPSNAMADLTLNKLGFEPESIAELLETSARLSLSRNQPNNALAAWTMAIESARKIQGPTAKCIECHILCQIALTLASNTPSASKTAKAAPLAHSADQDDLDRLNQAMMWARQAILVANQIDRSLLQHSECELAVFDAQCTRIVMLLETGKMEEAKEAFGKIMPLLEKRGRTDTVQMLKQCLQSRGLGLDFRPVL